MQQLDASVQYLAGSFVDVKTRFEGKITTAATRTAHKDRSIVRNLYRSCKACDWKLDVLHSRLVTLQLDPSGVNEFNKELEQAKRLVRNSPVKQELEVAERVKDILGMQLRKVDKLSKRDKKIKQESIARKASGFIYCDYLMLEALLLEFMEELKDDEKNPKTIMVIGGDNLDMITCCVASLFLYVFPLRNGTVEAMTFAEFCRPANSKSMQEDQVIILKHRDPKRECSDYFRAYPCWVIAMVIHYMATVRGAIAEHHSEILKPDSPLFVDSEGRPFTARLSETVQRNYYKAAKMSSFMRRWLGEEQYRQYKQALEKNGPGHRNLERSHIQEMAMVNSTECRAFYEVCKGIGEKAIMKQESIGTGDARDGREAAADGAAGEEHDKKTVKNHYMFQTRLAAIHELKGFLAGWKAQLMVYSNDQERKLVYWFRQWGLLMDI
jgi:hypothetical protein